MRKFGFYPGGNIRLSKVFKQAITCSGLNFKKVLKGLLEDGLDGEEIIIKAKLKYVSEIGIFTYTSMTRDMKST